MRIGLFSAFRPDHDRHGGVRPINILLLRMSYAIMATALAHTAWSFIIAHDASWEAYEATAWSVWAAVATLAASGVVYPLKMLPILLFDLFYKSLWLYLVAFPLWRKGELFGSRMEGTTFAYLPILLLFVFVPWGYVFKTYVFDPDRLRKRS